MVPKTTDAFHRCGLTSAVRPEDAEDLPWFHREADAVDHCALAIHLAKVTDLDNRHAAILPCPLRPITPTSTVVDLVGQAAQVASFSMYRLSPTALLL
jgi:hypothetical protein